MQPNYLNKMKLNFEKITNSTTKDILLDINDLEIDEDLFKQYYLQVF